MLFFSFYNSILTVQKNVPLLHKVLLHYKIIVACNTLYYSAVSGVIKHMGALKVYFSPVKFTFLLYPSVIRLC
jgi:hypothetical protein